MVDFREIINAYIISYNPTPMEKELAEKRLSICETCDANKIVLKKLRKTPICTECTCPIHKKIFTPLKGRCPLKKWDTIEDEKYFVVKEEKNKKTLL